MAKRTGTYRTTHGATPRTGHDPLYDVWVTMRQRCENPNNKDWGRYGGRGITVCERWQTFAAFRADMSPRPDGTTLERIDNDVPYAPANCRWATRKEQARNTARSLLLTVDGVTRSAVEWGERNPDPRLTGQRIAVRVGKGWSAERAVTEPVRTLNRRVLA